MARKRRTMNPELARQRRMNAYPTEMWEILQAARDGKEWQRNFDVHTLATAFLARFYRFRLDALECRVAGAIYLRDMMVTGTDALGGTFNTRSAGAGGPYRVTWLYIGSESGRAAAARADMEDSMAGGQMLVPTETVQPSGDSVESFLENVLASGRSEARELTPEQLAAHEEAKKTAAERLPQDLEQALCEHEVDATGSFCLKCRAPMSQ